MLLDREHVTLYIKARREDTIWIALLALKLVHNAPCTLHTLTMPMAFLNLKRLSEYTLKRHAPREKKETSEKACRTLSAKIDTEMYNLIKYSI